ncbi:MAG: hypothetical protein AAGF50_14715 [Pseudomonadota bacterium]
MLAQLRAGFDEKRTLIPDAAKIRLEPKVSDAALRANFCTRDGVI